MAEAKKRKQLDSNWGKSKTNRTLTEFKEDETTFLNNRNTKDAVSCDHIDIGTYKFCATGTKKNNEITEISLTDETLHKFGYAQHLYIPEWQQLEVYLTEPTIPKSCQFKIQGLVIRRKDGTGGMDMVTTLFK